MSDVTLSAAVRDSLLSLQSTTSLIERTQGRLSTGLEVAGAIDDPVRFFQAKSLSDRASDFDARKDEIDQGISTVTAALDATEAVEDIVSQLKGLALSAKSATDSQIGDLVSQFNDLRTQINNLTQDANYQGLNLVNGTGEQLTVQFSNETTSTLTVNSVDIRAGRDGLNIEKAITAGSGANFEFGFISADSLAAGASVTLSLANESNITLASGDTFTVAFGGQTLTFGVGTAAGRATYTAGTVLSGGGSITLTLSSTNTNAGEATISNYDTADGVEITDTAGVRVLDSDFTASVNTFINDLDSALTSLRSRSQTLGSNVALLQTRLDFTESYVNTLQSGSDKLTLADLNEEGANLLALQTRQQLGIQALSFAGQAEQGILGLFG